MELLLLLFFIWENRIFYCSTNYYTIINHTCESVHRTCAIKWRKESHQIQVYKATRSYIALSSNNSNWATVEVFHQVLIVSDDVTSRSHRSRKELNHFGHLRVNRSQQEGGEYPFVHTVGDVEGLPITQCPRNHLAQSPFCWLPL